MRKTLGVMIAAMLLVSLAGLAQARGAPPNDQPFAVEKVAVSVSPVVVSIPPLSTGYDVIKNISETKTLQTSVTTERRGQSTTGDWRNDLKPSLERGQPDPVLLA